MLPRSCLLLKDGGVVLLLGGDHVVDNPDELMGGSGEGLRRTHAGFQATEVVAEETVAAVQRLCSHAQGDGGTVLGWAGS